MQALSGYKTYLVAAGMILFAALSYWHPVAAIPPMTADDAVKMIFAALALMGIRSGVTTEISKLLAALGVNITDGNASTPAKVAGQAVSVARKGAPVLIGVLMTMAVLGSLTACASLQTLTPLQTLQAVETGFALAEGTYDAICSVNVPPAFCASNADAYAKSKLALEAAFQTAQAAIAASGNLDSASIEALLQAVANDWLTYNGIVNKVGKLNADRLGIAYHPVPLR